MRRVSAIILGTLAGLLLLLALLCQMGVNCNLGMESRHNRAVAELEKLCVKADSAAPLPENEGRLVAVSGTARLVDCPVLEDELLGVRKRTVCLTRTAGRNYDSDRPGYSSYVVEDIVLPSGLKVQNLHQEAPAVWALGVFRIHWMGPRIDFTRIPLAEMNPMPQVLQEATPNKMRDAWTYAGQAMDLSAAYLQMPETIETTLFGMQKGSEIVPYHFTMPRSLAVGMLLAGLWDDEFTCNEGDILGGDSLDRQVPDRIDDAERLYNAGCIVASVGGTLLAMLLLAVMLRFCLRRRVWPCMLYVGGGMLLLTLLNIWNAHWIW